MTTFGTRAQTSRPVQQPSPMPYRRYAPFVPIDLPDRTWPARRITAAPRWLSTDLRDGNQALIDPMTPNRKLRMFEMLVRMGYKEIEVGFPSASQTDFDFVRQLITEDRIPEDVQISVLTQAREDLIARTAQSLVGAHRANIHLYNATADLFRRVVFRISEQECIDLAVTGTELVMKYAEQVLGGTEFGYQYSPEIFTQTPTDFAVEVCNRVMQVWQPGEGREIILNLPATVEQSTPNTYADQIEYFSRHIANRPYVSISVHPHNDRGTAVAATELALMAGADRVEGCLFGHGERTGNVCLVTLGLNLFSQGIDPQIDFSDIDEIRRTVEYCTGLPVHPRHPYAGDLVYTAFSGSHQDAIKKGLEDLDRLAAESGISRDQVAWQAPYLPIDPSDLGRSYDSVIRINSQSGKGGVAYLLETEYGIAMPRRLQVEFSGEVQRYTDHYGGEMDAGDIWSLFARTYLNTAAPVRYVSHQLFDAGVQQGIRLTVEHDGIAQAIDGRGNGPIDAAVQALAAIGISLQVRSYEERSMGKGGDARACAFMEVMAGNGEHECYGVGLDENIVTASLKALVSGANRLIR